MSQEILSEVSSEVISFQLEAKTPTQPRKPKNVTKSIESSYAKVTKLEARKHKTPFEAKNECIIPQKVSTISENTCLRLKQICDYLK